MCKFVKSFKSTINSWTPGPVKSISMKKIQRFLYSEDAKGNKFIFYTRGPLIIFYFLSEKQKFLPLSGTSEIKPSDTESLEALIEQVNTWYHFAIKKKK